jgi:rare lipoprotein A
MQKDKFRISRPFNALAFGILLSLSFLLLASCASSGKSKTVASWYGPKFHGKLTASGERYNMYAMTCAHKQLPLGTRLRVTNRANGKSVVVVVNDRGPFVRGREIDLSFAAAKKIGIVGPGTGKVRYRIIGRDERYRKYIKDGRSIIAGNHKPVSGPFTIQVASFTEKSNAYHLMDGLKLNYRRVHIKNTRVDGKRFYRVRVGKFKKRSKALDYAKRLADEGYSVKIVDYE